jgi:hypothetical protein
MLAGGFKQTGNKEKDDANDCSIPDRPTHKDDLLENCTHAVPHVQCHQTIFGRRQLQRCRRLMPSRQSSSRGQLQLFLVFSDIRAVLHVPEQWNF